MDVQWFSKSPKGVATIYNSNITLNTVAANHFKTAYKVIVGFSQEEKALIIKAITKEELDLGLYKDLETRDISIKPSYGRVTGKDMINRLIEFYPINFAAATLNKFECEWSQEEKALFIHLERRLS